MLAYLQGSERNVLFMLRLSTGVCRKFKLSFKKFLSRQHLPIYDLVFTAQINYKHSSVPLNMIRQIQVESVSIVSVFLLTPVEDIKVIIKSSRISFKLTCISYMT